ncbi:MAG TPA: hypothetical protein VGH20_22320 [Myxococcales bacterium]|jgi:uncharacterized repeat protein (TIGR02543 family)
MLVSLWCRRGLVPALATLLFCLSPRAASAQSVVVSGYLSNFDAGNFEGKDTHGFEIQIDGITSADIASYWSGNKYGMPVAVDITGAVLVRYLSTYDPATATWSGSTIPVQPGSSFFAGNCYMVTAAYYQAGCDHFGVHLAASAHPRGETFHWLIEDAANPGTLIHGADGLFVPSPISLITPGATANDPPVLTQEIDLPVPANFQYGDAFWVKVFKTEINRAVTLDELRSDSTLVPQDAAEVESELTLVQASPPTNSKQRGKLVNGGPIGLTSHSVLRRYETYAFTGTYDPATHEALCADGTCSLPSAGEVGVLLNAQNEATNVAVPSVSIVKVGTGTISGSVKGLTCGSTCATAVAAGTVVTLTEKPASNWVFTGWTGACSGTAATCTLTVNDALQTTATFTAAAGGGGGTATGGGGGGAAGGGGGGTGGGGTGGGGGGTGGGGTGGGGKTL